MIQRLAVILAIAFLAAARYAECVEPANDPFKLHLPEGAKRPMAEKDAKEVHVPNDLDDCFTELAKMLSKAEIERIKNGPEDQIDRYYYSFSGSELEVGPTLGRFLGRYWQLDTETRLAKWFQAHEIYYPDAMGGIIAHSFWRRLNAKPIDLDSQFKARRIDCPKDLDDCFAELKKLLPKETVAKMKNGPEEKMVLYHHGLGMWLRNNWGLWKGSRLSKWFNGKGIRHPDDMSGIILDSFWRHLNGKPINFEEQVKHYQDYWKMVEAAEKVPKSWLALVDDGKYGESWDAAAERLKNTFAKDDFAKSLNATRKPLGKLKSRELQSITEPPSSPLGPFDGEDVEVKFKSVFKNKESAFETVTLMLDKDKKWRVSGYKQQDDRLPEEARNLEPPPLPVSPASTKPSEKMPLPFAPVLGVDVPKLQGPFYVVPNERSVPRPPMQGPQPIPDEPDKKE